MYLFFPFGISPCLAICDIAVVENISKGIRKNKSGSPIFLSVYADNIFRVGGAYLWSKNFQLDANIAFNTKDTPTVLNIAFGASYRLDFHKDKEIDNGNGNDGNFKKQKKQKKEKKSDDFNF